MRIGRQIQIFHDRYPLVGPIVWMLSIQYFAIQLIAAAAWHAPFSLRFNAISDLGNTVCGQYGPRLVCSPLHELMNASFVMLGVTMVTGASLFYREFTMNRLTWLGFGMMGLAGVGALLVGIFPENTVAAMHITGAALSFVLGNLAMILLAIAVRFPTWFKAYSFVSGFLGLITLLFLLTNHYGWLGFGGVERLVAYPQAIWMIVFGLYTSRNRWVNYFRKKTA